MISNFFETELTVVEALWSGLLGGGRENPVVYPGNPLCLVVELEAETRSLVENNQEAGRSRID